MSALCLQYGSDLHASTNSKEMADHKSTRGGALTEGSKVLPQNLNSSKQVRNSMFFYPSAIKG